MSANSTGVESPEGALDSLNATLNGTSTAAPGVMGFFKDTDFLLLELKLVFGALGIIYLGAHASLRRPPSAAPKKRRKPGQKPEDDEDRFAQGLERSDAIMFPLLAAVVLVGLYYLIQWLNDPTLLNKILRYYMSAVSIASLLTFYAHGMDFVTSFVFPRFWRGRDGALRKVDQKNRAVVACDDVGNPRATSSTTSPSPNPLPGLLAVLAPSRRLKSISWGLRDLLTRSWTIKLHIQGVCKEEGQIKFSHMMAMLLSIATALVYFSTSSPFLSNMLGYGMCYGSFLLLSPTDFVTASLVLVGLFFYDIVMVFYTPYMITVATKLDVPIKLTFEAATRKSILGLGDIVIPGMVMSCALRFDLWMHYIRKIKYESTDLKIIEKDASSGALVTRSETKHKEIKTRYVEAKGSWGERLWTRGTLFIASSQQVPTELAACRFSKTYFYATMIGYLAGMAVTLAMLLVFKRGQPALLYLVPGVLGSLFLTGLARGEMKQLWTYTEDGSLDVEDVVVDLDANGKMVNKIGQLENGVVDTTKAKDQDKDKNNDESKGKGEKKGQDGEEEKTQPANGVVTKSEKDASASQEGQPAGQSSHPVFLLSLEAAAEDSEMDKES